MWRTQQEHSRQFRPWFIPSIGGFLTLSFLIVLRYPRWQKSDDFGFESFRCSSLNNIAKNPRRFEGLCRPCTINNAPKATKLIQDLGWNYDEPLFEYWPYNLNKIHRKGSQGSSPRCLIPTLSAAAVYQCSPLSQVSGKY